MSEEPRGTESKAELELILLIVSDQPEATVSKLANIQSIGPFKLQTTPTLSLHDIYLDTTNHALDRKRINLRIRGIGDSYWITMKVRPRLISMKRHERQELEIPWSADSLKRIIGELGRKGVKLNLPDKIAEASSHVQVMRNMGLNVLQDRETERVPRNVIDNAGTGEVLAEMD